MEKELADIEVCGVCGDIVRGDTLTGIDLEDEGVLACLSCIDKHNQKA